MDEYVLEHLKDFTPDELKVQKRMRNQFQRRGYADVLQAVVADDYLGALISYIKVSFQLEYSMEHKEFWIVAPNPRTGFPGIPFPDDWGFPSDLWKREWWME
jgi:hypothetical protein